MPEKIEVKTAELIGPALDWAVAHATKTWEWAHEWFPTMTLDPTFRGVSDNAPDGHVNLVPRNPMRQGRQPFSPSTDWDQGGRLISQYRISFVTRGTGPADEEGNEPIVALTDGLNYRACEGKTHLVAACRAIVAAKFGDTVQIPAELAQSLNPA